MAGYLPKAVVSAQDEPPSGPIYIIQSGDTLYSIALKFGVTVNDLISANTFIDPNFLSTGSELVVPGLTGVEGKLITESIPLGQNLYSLSRYFGVSTQLLKTLNRLTSPAEVFAGSNLIIPQLDQPNYFQGLEPLAVNQSIFEYSIIENLSPWNITHDNQLRNSERVIPEEILFTSAKDRVEAPNPLLPVVTSLKISPLPLVQGNTTVIQITTSSPCEISGTLANYPLNFIQSNENEYIALQGIHAMAEPGLADLTLAVTEPSGLSRNFSQMVLLQQGFFAEDPPLVVDPSTIDKEITVPEDQLVRDTVTPVTLTKNWNGPFLIPVDEPWCIKSWYGNRRSYNGSDYTYFHTGVDYGVCATLNIYAPASGTVMFTGLLDVRGNSTIIDHGWGVYSGIWHQSEIKVKPGEFVQAGQLIGSIGGTGRVTGPHLHWEVWVNGVQVEPLQWLENSYP